MNLSAASSAPATTVRQSGWRRQLKAFSRHKYYFILFFPGLVFFLIFQYWPLFGITIAFKDYRMLEGILGSPWAGLKWFRILFDSPDFYMAFRNTVIISFYKLAINFPAPIILALLLNEVRLMFFKRVVQTIVYFPHFLSWVILGGILFSLFSANAALLNLLGMDTSPFMDPSKFRGFLVLSELWKEVGWGTIIYMAAIAGINQDLYEAARMDGASRFQLIRHITLPSIAGTIIIMLILRTGNILHVGFDQIFIMYNPLVYEVADVLDTYVYRVGLMMGRYSYATAAGLFQSVIGLVLLLITNAIARRVGERGIW
ncbi:ABC transporter permease subunit [Paenibacillus sp. J5C_2022]|uniref:ABC transporter permease n=1 Tax=Paenibacillus sp. J5C2022 TaxID=2977129 RepID=UPI0021CF167B|nr:ABC transporter permease subunit [Paenibacillus sp. J5C2022]MCU6711868.1 ABC transporter permease subunit [Paenibacillus sp. J5C2022]